MSLPIYKSDDQALMHLQTNWAQQLNPLVSSAICAGTLLKSIQLKTGANVISHKLGRNLQGWIVTRLRAGITIYDTQDSNATPALTLTLTASAPATIDLCVF